MSEKNNKKTYWGIYEIDSTEVHVRWFNEKGQRRSKKFWTSSNSKEKIQQFYEKMITIYDQEECNEKYRNHNNKLKHKSRLKNKDIRQEKFDCECGGRYSRETRSHHFKTKKHQNFLNDNPDVEIYIKPTPIQIQKWRKRRDEIIHFLETTDQREIKFIKHFIMYMSEIKELDKKINHGMKPKWIK
jgi:chromosome condensin MukBEF ATPase and DNA-binding subunit MukB